ARYTEDFAPMASVLGAAGFFAFMRWARQRRLGRPLAIGAAAASAVVGPFFGVTLAFNDLPPAHVAAYLEIAHALDAVEARILLKLAPDFWRSTYLNGTVRERSQGVFYSEGTMVPLTIRGAPVSLRIISLLQ